MGTLVSTARGWAEHFSVLLRPDPNPYPIAWITSSYSEEAEEGENYWWVIMYPSVLTMVSWAFHFQVHR